MTQRDTDLDRTSESMEDDDETIARKLDSALARKACELGLPSPLDEQLAPRRHFAVCGERLAYIFACYPWDIARYRRDCGLFLIGDFATYAEARDALFALAPRH